MDQVDLLRQYRRVVVPLDEFASIAVIRGRSRRLVEVAPLHHIVLQCGTQPQRLRADSARVCDESGRFIAIDVGAIENHIGTACAALCAFAVTNSHATRGQDEVELPLFREQEVSAGRQLWIFTTGEEAANDVRSFLKVPESGSHFRLRIIALSSTHTPLGEVYSTTTFFVFRNAVRMRAPAAMIEMYLEAIMHQKENQLCSDEGLSILRKLRSQLSLYLCKKKKIAAPLLHDDVVSDILLLLPIFKKYRKQHRAIISKVMAHLSAVFSKSSGDRISAVSSSSSSSMSTFSSSSSSSSSGICQDRPTVAPPHLDDTIVITRTHQRQTQRRRPNPLPARTAPVTDSAFADEPPVPSDTTPSTTHMFHGNGLLHDSTVGWATSLPQHRGVGSSACAPLLQQQDLGTAFMDDAEDDDNDDNGSTRVPITSANNFIAFSDQPPLLPPPHDFLGDMPGLPQPAFDDPYEGTGSELEIDTRDEGGVFQELYFGVDWRMPQQGAPFHFDTQDSAHEQQATSRLPMLHEIAPSTDNAFDNGHGQHWGQPLG